MKTNHRPSGTMCALCAVFFGWLMRTGTKKPAVAAGWIVAPPEGQLNRVVYRGDGDMLTQIGLGYKQ